MATATNGVTTTSTANATTYASGAFTPTVGDLLVVFAEVSATAQTPGAMTASANGITFTLVTNAASGGGAHMLYCFVANQLVPSSPASMTVTMDVTGDAGTGCVIGVIKVAGMTNVGSAAILQFARQQNISTGVPAPVFASACQTANVTLGAVGEETGPTTNSAVPPTGTTELGDAGYTTPAHSLEYWARNSGFTGTTPTWVSVVSNIFASIAVELDTSAGGSTLNVSATPANSAANGPTATPNEAIPASNALATANAPTATPRMAIACSPANATANAAAPSFTLPGTTLNISARPATAAARPQPKIIIPGYVYPDAVGTTGRLTWEAWINGADAVSAIVANPGSPGGPGTFTDSNYAAVIAAAQARGVRILGYVDEGYARPTASASLMDDFNSVPTQALTARANWDGSPAFGQTSYQTNGTPDSAVKVSPGTRASNFLTYVWGDGEISLKFKTVSAGSSDNFYIYNRWDGATTAYYAYVETSGYVEIYKWVAGVSTRILVPTAISGGLAVGGTISLRTYSSTVELWYQPPAGTDTLLGRVTDTSISASGKFGFEVQDIATFSFDSVSGGAILSTQKDQVDRWFTLYSIRDIFFDQVTSDAASQPYCKLITDYAHAAGASVVMLNQGTTVDESYAPIAELLCTFEGTKTSYDSYVPDSWNSYYPGKMVHLVYNVANSTDMATVVDKADDFGAGYVYAVDTSVWFAQSTFFDAEIAKLLKPSTTFTNPVTPANATAGAGTHGVTLSSTLAISVSPASGVAGAGTHSPRFALATPVAAAVASAPAANESFAVAASPATATAGAGASLQIALLPASASASAATTSPRFALATVSALATASAPASTESGSISGTPAHALANAPTSSPGFAIAVTPANVSASGPSALETYTIPTSNALATAGAAAPVSNISESSTVANASASSAAPSETFAIPATPAHAVAGAAQILNVAVSSATASASAGVHSPQMAVLSTNALATASGPAATGAQANQTSPANAAASAAAAVETFAIPATPAHAGASSASSTPVASVSSLSGSAAASCPASSPQFALACAPASASASSSTHSPRFDVASTNALATASAPNPSFTGGSTLNVSTTPANASASAVPPAPAFAEATTPATATASVASVGQTLALPVSPATCTAGAGVSTPVLAQSVAVTSGSATANAPASTPRYAYAGSSATSTAGAGVGGVTLATGVVSGTATANSATSSPRFGILATPGSAVADSPTTVPEKAASSTPANASASAPAPAISFGIPALPATATASGSVAFVPVLSAITFSPSSVSLSNSPTGTLGVSNTPANVRFETDPQSSAIEGSNS